ncbi:MAG TPA: GPW/gp25 family protein [Kofleriaceae bacterium]|nr:GPW/gp25 family protein [Kofleriaceae bacterium]
MFLERKFMSSGERAALFLDAGGLAALPEGLQDVVRNLVRLLATERGVGHLLPDFGFSRSGHWSAEGVIAHFSRELRENLPRYERRFELVEIEAELDDDGHPELIVLGRAHGVDGLVTLTFDPVRRRLREVRLG